jgi:hypothetical protein
MFSNHIRNQIRNVAKGALLAGVLAGSVFVSTGGAQTAAPSGQPAAAPAPFRFPENKMARKAQTYYGLVWGVDNLSAKWAESGEIIRFSYRVVDAELAKPINDKKNEPGLIDPQAGVKLVIPSLENVGQLRQTSAPIAGRTYWMAFSNSGRPVKRGDRVDVVIGQFKATGLVVE